MAKSSSERDPKSGVLGSPPDEAGRSCPESIRPEAPRLSPPWDIMTLAMGKRYELCSQKGREEDAQ